MSLPVKRVKTRSGKRLEIYQDDNPDSPREWSNVGTMAIFHSRYTFGDDVDFDHKDFDGWSDMENHILNTIGAKVCLPIYMYEHGGVTIKTSPFSCNFDSGKVGFIYTTESKIVGAWGDASPASVQLAMDCLEAEVLVMDQYLNGDVYGFKLIKVSPLDDPELDEEEDSCWGFFGEDLETNGILDHLCKEDHPIIS